MKKIFQQNRWVITIIFTLLIFASGFACLYFINPLLTISILIVVSTGFLYLCLTKKLNLLLKLNWKTMIVLFLKAVILIIFTNWFTSFGYGLLFPNPDKQLLEGQNVINEKFKESSEREKRIEKRIEEIIVEKNKSFEEVIQENKELKEKLQKESIASISQELQTEIDQFFSEFKYPEARNSIDTFLEKHENIKQKDLSILHYLKALIYDAEYNYLKEKEELETAIALDKENPLIAHQYGLVLHSLGSEYYDKAIKSYERALKIYLESPNKSYSNIATSYDNLGVVWLSKEDYDKAIDYQEKALEIRLELPHENIEDVALSYNNLGTSFHLKRDYNKSIIYYKKALNILYNDSQNQHPLIYVTESNLKAAEEKNDSLAL